MSPARTCRAMAKQAQQRINAGGRDRCWATRTTAVPDVYSRVKFMLVAGAYSWRHACCPYHQELCIRLEALLAS